MAAVELTGRAMASDVQLVVVDGPRSAAAAGLELLRALEDRWSRFREDSDVTRLNTHVGRAVVVDEVTIALVEAMVDAWRFTAGRYDPTVLPNLMRSGYTHSIVDQAIGTSVDRRADGAGDPAGLAIDNERMTVTLPVGTAIDPGGIGKGLAADMAVDLLTGLGASGALVSVGGDIAAAGTAPSGDGWTIGIEHPLRPDRDLGTITVCGGGIATSSTHSRRWVTAQGGSAHHLIDPATGTTSDTDIAAVTVVATKGWEAEAHATALAVAGTGGFDDYTATHRIDALAVTHEGVIRATPALTSLTHPEATV